MDMVLITAGLVVVMAIAPFSISLLGVRRFGRLLTALRTEDIVIRCLPDRLTVTSRSRSHSVYWTQVRSVTTDRDYLSIGPIPLHLGYNLLLLGPDAPGRPTLGLRWTLLWALSRYRFYPLSVAGITIVPLRFVEERGLKALPGEAAAAHRRATGRLGLRDSAP